MKKYVVLFLLPVLLLYSCSLSEKEEKNVKENVPVHTENYIPGIIRLKVTEAYSRVLELEKNALFPDMDVSVSRTFPYCGKFEERTRKAGLHLWYDITFDSNIPLTKAGKDLTAIEGIEIIAYLPKIIFENAADETIYPFSDPLLPLQWHYHNDGTLSGSIAGADVNAFEAWKYYTTGSEKVIVAVVDGGVAFNHEDLANNMWINRAELEGESGKDDDGNGYYDDVYGFNFINGTGHITPEDHGTHVAGTIAAVNNNHTGVGGIAGGDGINKGVLIMSCQVLDANDQWGDAAQAIKYAADNGAVICQNSWSYKEYTDKTKVYIEAAIDYFNTNAGMDENGIQVGPMAGGLVVFAAGNNNTDTGYPASYEGVMAVAALKNNFEKASYSNFGKWVDIAAPGGQGTSALPAGMVYSTITNNQYGYKNGTSMSCPHVSGVAALVVSHVGGPGFTNAMLWDALVNNAKNTNAYNMQYQNLLGSGMVDAYATLASFSTLAPDPVREIHSSVRANHITLSWEVPKDEDDGKAYGYVIYGHLADDPGESFSLTAYTERRQEPGDTVSVVLRELDFSTSYIFAVQAFDYAQNKSDISESVQVTTDKNNAPIITPLNSTTITLKAHESGTLSFKIREPDQHAFTCTLTPGPDTATLSMRNDSTAVVNIHAPAAREGTYTGVLTATDSYGLSSAADFTYIVLKNNPPVPVATMDNIYFGSIGGTARLNVSDYFYDPDEEPLKYTFSTSTSNASVKLEKDILYITGKNYGYCTITVTATDALGASCSTDVLVLVRDGKQPVDLYPNPVTDTLHIRMGEPAKADITIISSAGTRVFEGSFEIAPFFPAKIDMTPMSGGTYTVKVRTNGQEYAKTIIKL